MCSRRPIHRSRGPSQDRFWRRFTILSDVSLTIPLVGIRSACRPDKAFARRRTSASALPGFDEIDRAVPDFDVAGHLDHRSGLFLGPLNMDQSGCVFRIALGAGLSVGCPLAGGRLDPVLLIDRGNRNPGLCLAPGVRDFQSGNDLEFSPCAGLRRECALSDPISWKPRHQRDRGACLQYVASIKVHDRFPHFSDLKVVRMWV